MRPALQIVLAVSAGRCLLGTVTDGDIRRGLAARPGHEQLDRDDHLSRSAGGSPAAQPRDGAAAHARQQDSSVARRRRRAARRRAASVGSNCWLRAARPNLMVIMAGRPGQPFASAHRKLSRNRCCRSAVSRCSSTSSSAPRRRDFEHFVLAVHYLGHMIEDYFGDGSRWQIADRLSARGVAARNRGRAWRCLNPRPDAPVSGLQWRCADRYPLWRIARLSLSAPRRGHHGGAAA